MCLAFAEECLFQLNNSNELNQALKYLPDFIDRYPFQGLFLLSSLEDISLVQLTLKLKTSTVLHNLISSNVQVIDEELVVYKKLIGMQLLTAANFKLDDITWFERVVKQKNLGMLRNITKCFPSELTHVVAKLLKPKKNQYGLVDTSELKLNMLGIELLEVIGLANLEYGSWYQELAITLVDLVDLEEDVKAEDFDNTKFPGYLNELRLSRAQNFLRSTTHLPDELLEFVLQEATTLFAAIYVEKTQKIPILWFDLIDAWVQRGNDFPDYLKRCFVEPNNLLRGEEFSSKLSLIQRSLNSFGYKETSILLNNIVNWNIPF